VKLSTPFIVHYLRSDFYVARISYDNSVGLSVRPSILVSRPGTVSRPGEIETSGFHHMIPLCL